MLLKAPLGRVDRRAGKLVGPQQPLRWQSRRRVESVRRLALHDGARRHGAGSAAAAGGRRVGARAMSTQAQCELYLKS
eukprot:595473-Prymnesium_polylepis.1